MAAFVHRGVVEGFYGRPWSHEDRLWLIERLGAWRMNRYVYAPKNDPLQRERWREAYPEETVAAFRELVESGKSAGVEVGFALSPGCSMRYSSAEERTQLIAKFKAFRELGSGFLSLALDDVPTTLTHEEDRRSFATLADAHVELTRALHDALGPEVTLWLVPTDYLGVEATDYLEALGEGLDREVEVGWTGRTVVSPTIESDEAARRASTLKRRLLLWDNIPVADGPMRSMLHLGPYAGRHPRLAEHVSGVLLNPMQQVRASAIAIRSAARYLDDPSSYDPEAAWEEAIQEIGAGDPTAFCLFAQAHRFSPQWPDDRDRELEAGLERLSWVLKTEGDPREVLEELRGLVVARLEVNERIRKRLRDRRLVEELEPWLASHRRETRRIEAALQLLTNLSTPGNASTKVMAFFSMEGQLSLEPETGKTSYGPRRVLYPQLVSMGDNSMAFGRDASLVLDRCLADEFVRLAEMHAIRLLLR